VFSPICPLQGSEIVSPAASCSYRPGDRRYYRKS